MSNIIVTTSMIHDARWHDWDGFVKCMAHASRAGHEYLLFNGAVHRVSDELCVFIPEFGFWEPESCPFTGWADGYEYQGDHEWLLGKDVPCAMLDKDGGEA